MTADEHAGRVVRLERRVDVPAREALLSESMHETDEGREVTTKVFEDRVEIIERHEDGTLDVTIKSTDQNTPV